MSESSREVILIVPTWPGMPGGGGLGLATLSEVYACSEYFSRVNLVVISVKAKNTSAFEDIPNLNWRSIELLKQRPWKRAIRSIFRKCPAITIQFLVKADKMKAVLSSIRLNHKLAQPPVVIFSSMPLGLMIPVARKIFPHSPIITHSHNVMAKAFAGFAERGSPISRLVWYYELKKIRCYEKWVARNSDIFWTVSNHDIGDYQNILDIKSAGTLGVFLDIDRYSTIPAGDPKTIVYVGSIDLRKGIGMTRFIRETWPLIRGKTSSVRLVLAGVGTEKYHDPLNGITGLGFVEDERDVIGRGQIFINPQIDGSGIQLKSIVAMLSGRILVTSITGSEGVAGTDKEHFFAGDDPTRQAELIADIVSNPARYRGVARRGQELAQSIYNRQHFLSEAHKLLVSALP